MSVYRCPQRLFDGYRIVIYFNDHLPPHVHVKKDRAEARVQILPDIALIDQRGFNNRDVKTVLTLVEHHRDLLVETWRNIHGEDI